MKIYTGVDRYKKAVIVSLTGSNHEVKTIQSAIKSRETIPGEARVFSLFWISIP